MPPPPSPSYDEALAFWYGRVNYEQRSPKPGDLKLDRMRALMRLLGDPQDQLRIVHVAGSKGKGSTAAMLAAILGRAGYRTGLFTSPHLSRHEERFQIDGRPISPAELAQLLTEIRQVVESHRDFAQAPPTFFELATAAFAAWCSPSRLTSISGQTRRPVVTVTRGRTSPASLTFPGR